MVQIQSLLLSSRVAIMCLSLPSCKMEMGHGPTWLVSDVFSTALA
jgi:hypothetical protein